MDIFPPPLTYPQLLSKPLNLEKNADYENEISIKQNMRKQMRNSFYFIESVPTSTSTNDFNSTIQRYSDKYSKQDKIDFHQWQPQDWTRLPKELKYFYEKDQTAALAAKNKAKKQQAIKRKTDKKDAQTKAAKKLKVKSDKDYDLDSFEKIIAENESGNEAENDENEPDNEEKNEKKKDSAENDEENEEGEELQEDEEDLEEENDYVDTYFDNGEDYIDDDGGGGDDDGPVY